MSEKNAAINAHLMCSKNVEALLEHLRKFLLKSHNKLSLLMTETEQQPDVHEHFIHEQESVGSFVETFTIEVVGFLLTEQRNFVSTIDTENVLAKLDDLSGTAAACAHFAQRATNDMQPQSSIAAAIEEGIVEEFEKASVVDHNESAVTAASECEPIMLFPAYGKKDDILNVEIVSVQQLSTYVGMIKTDAAAWHCTDEDIESEQMLMDAPIINQLVIAKYDVDGLWYRALCLHVDVDSKACEVVFIDFGNKELVHALVQLDALAHPTDECVQRPFGLVVLRISNVSQSDDEQIPDLGKQIANTLVLKKTFKFKYLEQDANGEVSVKAVDDDFKNYLQLLALTKMIKMQEM